MSGGYLLISYREDINRYKIGKRLFTYIRDFVLKSGIKLARFVG